MSKQRCLRCRAPTTRKNRGWTFNKGGYLCRDCVPLYDWKDEEMRTWAIESLRGSPPEPRKRVRDVKGQTMLWGDK